MSLREKKPTFILLNKKRLSPEVKENIIKKRFTITKKKKLGPWNEEEDKVLKKWVEENGPCHWGKCAQVLQERTGKQCRERWKNCLNGAIKKGDWTAEENLLVLKLYDKFKSYKKMAVVFPGRTENSLKNRFYIQLRKIAIKNNKEQVSKIKLNELKSYYDEAIETAENMYFRKNVFATKEKLEEYLKEIENLIKNAKKGTLIYLNDLRDKIIKNNYDSDSFSGDDDEQENENKKKKNKKIRNNSNKKIKEKKMIKENQKVSSKKEKLSKKKSVKSSKKNLRISSKNSANTLKSNSRSRLFSKNIIDFAGNSRYSFRNRNSTRKHLDDDFAFEKPMDIKKSNSNLSRNNSNYLRGPSYFNGSFNIFKGSFNNSFLTPSKRGSQFNIFNTKSGYINDF